MGLAWDLDGDASMDTITNSNMPGDHDVCMRAYAWINGTRPRAEWHTTSARGSMPMDRTYPCAWSGSCPLLYLPDLT